MQSQQKVLLHLVHGCLFKGRKLGEFVRRKAVQLELGAAAFHSRLVALVDIHLHFRLRKFADNAHQLFGGEGNRTVPHHVGRHHARDADVEVGCSKAHLPVFSFNLYIGKNGQRRLGRHHTDYLSQAIQKYLLGNSKLHVTVLLSASHPLTNASLSSSSFSVKSAYLAVFFIKAYHI